MSYTNIVLVVTRLLSANQLDMTKAFSEAANVTVIASYGVTHQSYPHNILLIHFAISTLTQPPVSLRRSVLGYLTRYALHIITHRKAHDLPCDCILGAAWVVLYQESCTATAFIIVTVCANGQAFSTWADSVVSCDSVAKTCLLATGSINTASIIARVCTTDGLSHHPANYSPVVLCRFVYAGFPAHRPSSFTYCDSGIKDVPHLLVYTLTPITMQW